MQVLFLDYMYINAIQSLCYWHCRMPDYVTICTILAMSSRLHYQGMLTS